MAQAGRDWFVGALVLHLSTQASASPSHIRPRFNPSHGIEKLVLGKPRIISPSLGCQLFGPRTVDQDKGRLSYRTSSDFGISGTLCTHFERGRSSLLSERFFQFREVSELGLKPIFSAFRSQHMSAQRTISKRNFQTNLIIVAVHLNFEGAHQNCFMRKMTIRGF